MSGIGVDVAAVTVTYGDRFGTVCRRTVESALREGVSRVLIVDNGSAEASARAIDEFADAEPRVTVMRNADNQGSARAFRAAMIWASATASDLVWLLDDDNAVDSGTLAALLAARSAASSAHRAEVIMTPRRVPNALHERLANGAPTALVYPPAGAFLGFDALATVARRLRRESPLGEGSSRVVEVPYAPYGGMLVPRELLERGTLPDPRLQLYADDTVWTSSLVHAGHRILLALDIVIADSEGKWTQVAHGNSLTNSLRSPRRDRLYLSTRNRVLFDHQNLSGFGSRLRYLLNRSTVMLFALLSAIRHGERDGWRVFRRAVRDAESGDLSHAIAL